MKKAMTKKQFTKALKAKKGFWCYHCNRLFGSVKALEAHEAGAAHYERAANIRDEQLAPKRP